MAGGPLVSLHEKEPRNGMIVQATDSASNGRTRIYAALLVFSDHLRVRLLATGYGIHV